MTALADLICTDFFAAATVFCVTLAALSYVVYLACEAIGGKQS